MKKVILSIAVFIISAFQGASACCVFLPEKVDTLPDGSYIIYPIVLAGYEPNGIERIGGGDTLSSGNLLKELVRDYRQSQYALIGEVSEVNTFRHPLNDSMDGEMDSVYFSIHSTLKGDLAGGFWSLDAYNHSGHKYFRGEDTAAYISIMSIQPGPYTNIMNKLALMLTSSLDTIRQTGLEPAGYCTFSNSGYYIGSDFTIEKSYSYGSGIFTITVHMADFLDAIAVSVQSPGERWQAAPRIGTLLRGQTMIISLPAAQGPLPLRITDLRGTLVKSLAPGRDGNAAWDVSSIPGGLYIISTPGLSGGVSCRVRL